MLEKLNHSDFAGHLNTKFRVVETAEPFELELVEISEPRTNRGQEYFSLLFRGADTTFLPQKLYELEHETLGRGSLFLVPIGKSDGSFQYEAVFNRLKKD
jgi:hypothetical protein